MDGSCPHVVLLRSELTACLLVLTGEIRAVGGYFIPPYLKVLDGSFVRLQVNLQFGRRCAGQALS